MRPVASGTMPRNAHGDCGPTNARDSIAEPAMILMILSALPTFFFMIYSSL
jgi:hypothetical protein